MENSRIAIIGGGNMGRALIDGLMNRGKDMRNILLIEIDEEKREQLKKKYNIGVNERIDSAIEHYDAIIVSVKPQDIREVFKDINSRIGPDHLVISVAAGITLGVMERYITKTRHLVRTMPNIAARVGKSVCAMCNNSALSDEKRRFAIDIMESIGVVIELEETHLDTITGLSGSGPAFVFLMIEALTDSGVLLGISRDVSYRLAVETVFGSVCFLREHKIHPAVAKEMVTSPGGTAIEGLLTLEEGGFKALVMNAVRAAAEKAAKIGKKKDD